MKDKTRTDSMEVRKTLTTPIRDDAERSFERFENLARMLVRVPKEEVDEKRAEHDRKKKRTE